LSRVLVCGPRPERVSLPFDPGKIPAFGLPARARTAILHLVTEK
jgi:hypothetical protein